MDENYASALGISYWQSEKDGGQAAAIIDGFRRATGTILAWLNSDDFYLPGTLNSVANQLNAGKNEILLGNCFHFFQDSAQASGSDIAAHYANSNLLLWDYIVQPSSFWTRQTWEHTGELNQELHFAFDWEWYIRAQQTSAKFVTCQRYLSAYRYHEAHKTSTGGAERLREIADIYRTYAGEEYQTLFQRLLRSQKRIGESKRWIRRFKLSRFESSLMKIMLPEFYRNYSTSEINDVLAMCHQ